MKKTLILMCMGGMLALCTPLTASESTIDPPITREITLKKVKHNTEKAETEVTKEESVRVVNNDDPGDNKADIGGGVIIISGTALLLLIILLILLL